jgi:hypothetical protein
MDTASQKQLDTWIGEPCIYTLLYKLSSDGRSNATFHQCCDQRGPTVTLIKLIDGRTFGGYTSTSWSSATTKFMPSFKSFLFMLYTSGRQWKPVVCWGIPGHPKSVFHSRTSGPSFGANDLVINLDNLDASYCAISIHKLSKKMQ